MNKFEYKYLRIGDKFFFQGQEYIKTNHQRGCYIEEGRKVFKQFKKSHIVKTTNSKFDVECGNGKL